MGPATGGALGALGARGRKQHAEAAVLLQLMMDSSLLNSRFSLFFIGTHQSRFFKLPNIIFSRKEQFSVEEFINSFPRVKWFLQ